MVFTRVRGIVRQAERYPSCICVATWAAVSGFGELTTGLAGEACMKGELIGADIADCAGVEHMEKRCVSCGLESSDMCWPMAVVGALPLVG
jgi:hypothetical protein